MLQLIQIRICDGKCCKEGPRFPNFDNSDCIYRTIASGKDDFRSGSSGCKLMSGEEIVPDEPSKIFIEQTAEKVFKDTCVDWPQNTPENKQRIGKTGGCCWQWVDDGK